MEIATRILLLLRTARALSRQSSVYQADTPAKPRQVSRAVQGRQEGRCTEGQATRKEDIPPGRDGPTGHDGPTAGLPRFTRDVMHGIINLNASKQWLVRSPDGQAQGVEMSNRPKFYTAMESDVTNLTSVFSITYVRAVSGICRPPRNDALRLRVGVDQHQVSRKPITHGIILIT